MAEDLGLRGAVILALTGTLMVLGSAHQLRHSEDHRTSEFGRTVDTRLVRFGAICGLVAGCAVLGVGIAAMLVLLA